LPIILHPIKYWDQEEMWKDYGESKAKGIMSRPTAQRSAASRANEMLQVRVTVARGLSAATFCSALFIGTGSPFLFESIEIVVLSLVLALIHYRQANC